MTAAWDMLPLVCDAAEQLLAKDDDSLNVLNAHIEALELTADGV